MEKPSSFDRVVGKISEGEKNQILWRAAERFDNQVFEELKGKEREKTSEELQLIALANELTNDVLKKYGLKDFDIPSKNIHIISEEAWLEIDDENSLAFYSASVQAVAVREQSANIAFLHKSIHELLHFKSYGAAQVTSADRATDYRTGLVVHTRDGEETYFRNLNEAVTEEMTKRLLLSAQEYPLIEKEIKDSREIVKKFPNALNENGDPLFHSDTYYVQVEGGKAWGQSVGRLFGLHSSIKNMRTESLGYPRERRFLNTLIDRLLVENSHKFSNREEVFELFAKGMMTGNLLEIGKLIDGTFGAGIFRRIGEMDDDVDAQMKFVETL